MKKTPYQGNSLFTIIAIFVRGLRPRMGTLFFNSSSSINRCFVYCFCVCLGSVELSWVQFSCSVMSDSLRPHGPQPAMHPCPSSTPEVHPNPCPLSQWCHPAISSSVVPVPAFNLSQHQGLFKWVSSSHEVAKVLEFQLQHHSFQRNPRADLPQNGLVGSPCSPRDSQESSPTPQLKSINSSAVSFLYSPNLVPIHDHWKNHSLN